MPAPRVRESEARRCQVTIKERKQTGTCGKGEARPLHCGPGASRPKDPERGKHVVADCSIEDDTVLLLRAVASHFPSLWLGYGSFSCSKPGARHLAGFPCFDTAIPGRSSSVAQ